jgi:nicotinamidase-related amidase
LIASKIHPNLLNADNTILVVVDMQQVFVPHLFEPERVVKNICTLIKGVSALRIPVLSATQNKEKLGDVVPEVKELLPVLLPPFDKMCFSCFSDPAFRSELERSGRKQVILCGIESHVCVNQTAHEIIAAGFQAHIAVDSITSRTESNWRVGIDKMRQGGALLTSVEMALFELMRVAGTPEFREVSKLIK